VKDIFLKVFIPILEIYFNKYGKAFDFFKTFLRNGVDETEDEWEDYLNLDSNWHWNYLRI